MDSVITTAALGDNLIYIYPYGRDECLAVDPGDGPPVLRVLKQHNLRLRAILITHHHSDHTAGVADLKQKTGCTVLGGDERRIPGIDRIVGDGEILTFASSNVQVLVTPGHTRTSVCYYVQPSQSSPNGILWTGDTMFIGGCGRLLECDAQAMWESLCRLASLPDDTLVYCGHDYTLENCEFALSVEPDSGLLKQRLGEIKQIQSRGGLTVPSPMAQEKMMNPFLRADEPAINAALGMGRADAVEVFAELRRRKDVF